MEEIGSILLSWQFCVTGLFVAFVMMFLMKVGEILWKVKWKWLRQGLIFIDGVSPWLPPLFGAVICFFLPKPGFISELSVDLGIIAMIVLGLFAGSTYERIWKGTKQIIEAKGLDLDSEEAPKKQKKGRL